MADNDTTRTGGLAQTLMRWVWRTPPATVAESVRRRVTIHLIPYLFFLYILAYLDRANISVAALGMMESPSEGGLGFDKAIIGFGAGVFFWGYWILEVPSTLSVLRWGARWVFVRILILWGLSCMLLGVIDTPFATSLFAWLPEIDPDAGVLRATDRGIDWLFGWVGGLFGHDEPLRWLGGLANFYNGLPTDPVNQFYFFRFRLGFFVGGFFPSVILYLSVWFRSADRARAIAAFMSAIPLSLALGSPLSGLMLELDWFDLAGWRWIFLLQGFAPVLAGFATLFFLPDRPEKATWLRPEERDYLTAELQREQQSKKAHGWHAWTGHLGAVLLLTAVYFCLNTTSYGVTNFLPIMIREFSGLPAVWAAVVTTPVYVLALLGMQLNGRHSDRTNERIGHVVVPLLFLSLGLSLAGWLCALPVWPVLILIFLVGTFKHAHLPAFWPIPSMFLGSAAAASAIGFINMIGNLGGSFGPWIVGELFQQQRYADGLYTLSLMPLIAVGIILVVGYFRRQRPAGP